MNLGMVLTFLYFFFRYMASWTSNWTGKWCANGVVRILCYRNVANVPFTLFFRKTDLDWIQIGFDLNKIQIGSDQIQI